MKTFIKGIGYWFPEKLILNKDWPADFGTVIEESERVFNDIPPPLGDAVALSEHYLELESKDKFLGAVARYKAEGITAADAEYNAAKNAVKGSGISPDQIDVVISYTTVPDRIVPPSAGEVAHRLGINNALCFGMDAACSTLISQLIMASSMIKSGFAKNVLLTQSHLLLRAIPFLHPATPGLGDAATACVVSSSGLWEILELHAKTHGEFFDAVTWIRDDSDTPWWKKGDDFRLGSLNRAQAKQLMRDTVQFGALTVKEAVEKAGLQVEDLNYLCSVQPRGWIPGAIMQNLGHNFESALVSYKDFAHLGACGPIVNLLEGYYSGKIKNKSIIALYGQGAGFTRGAAILKGEVESLF